MPHIFIKVEISVAPHPHQYCVLEVCIISATPLGLKWFLVVALICIILLTGDIKHLFMTLLATHISSFREYIRENIFK